MIDFLHDGILRLLASVLVGALIGIEREYRSKSAGLRTFTLMCLGSTIFTMLSDVFESSGTGRIAANIVTGIGFLGAGVIFKNEERVQGLTTAAIIWVTAALGMAIGDGYIELSIVGAVLVLAILLGFERVEKLVDRYNQTRTYHVVRHYSPDVLDLFKQDFRQFGLKESRGRQTVRKGQIAGSWKASGRHHQHKKLIDYWLKQEDIKEVTF